ncbi:hypothetical protein RJ640_017174 [Escallonia rubra]|uniref:HVA22-like protein n=1 Tax=Escallonia rubra TaxID=112253 RepID=A0AA88RQN9_9ASTE|nr:hypothetical protein RJ640_017174 [Escallonia rubra]
MPHRLKIHVQPQMHGTEAAIDSVLSITGSKSEQRPDCFSHSSTRTLHISVVKRRPGGLKLRAQPRKSLRREDRTLQEESKESEEEEEDEESGLQVTSESVWGVGGKLTSMEVERGVCVAVFDSSLERIEGWGYGYKMTEGTTLALVTNLLLRLRGTHIVFLFQLLSRASVSKKTVHCLLLRFMKHRMAFGYAYPAYNCFKAVEKNEPDVDHLLFWCQYWLPMYGEAKLVLFVYLWHPRTKGVKYLYSSFFRPYVAKHERDIDGNLLELTNRAGKFAVLFWEKAASYGQTRFFEFLQYVSSQSAASRSQPTQASTCNKMQ